MFGKKVKLFKLMGFTVSIDISWIVIFLLVLWTLATGYFPQVYESASQSEYWWMGATGALGLFVSIVVHEFSHSLVARKFGMPMKGITLFIFGGVAEMHEEPPSPKAEFFMAIVGPITSLIIGGAALGTVSLLGNGIAPLSMIGILRYLGTINIVLAIFNLLPAFPLDGGRVARSAIWAWKKDLRKATRIASNLGVGFGYGLIALGIFSLFAGALVGGFWWILLGFFLSQAARSSYQNLMVQSGLSGEKVSRFMRADPVTVREDMHLDDLVENYIYKHHYKMFPVVRDGKTISCVTTRDVKQFDREEWPKHSVGEIAASCSIENTTFPNEDAMSALQKMQKTGNGRLIVIDNEGALKGVVTLKDMLDYLSLKFDLEQEHHHNRAA